MFGCRHKFGPVIDGYQYCGKCGKAISAQPVQCAHKWEFFNTLKSRNILQGNVYSITYLLKCEKCGDMKKEAIE